MRTHTTAATVSRREAALYHLTILPFVLLAIAAGCALLWLVAP